MSTRRVGRRPGDPATTKATILSSALRVFASVGYDRATMRSIANEAGVDPALIVHHFGNKDALFLAAHKADARRSRRVFASTGHSADRVEEIARSCLRRYGTQGTVEQSLLKSAMTHPPAANLLNEITSIDASEIADAFSIDPTTDENVELIQNLLIGAAVACLHEQLRPRNRPTIDSNVVAMFPAVLQSAIAGTNR